jgi:8-oxo-dGTP diphosphatase
MKKEYPRPMLTVDIVVLRGDEVLLIQRGKPPFEGMWALPGGFVNEGEDPVDAAVRELREETGIAVNYLPVLVGVYGNAGRDPRGWVVSVAYAMEVVNDTVVTAGDDAAAAKWVSLEAVKNGDVLLAFDHGQIVEAATYELLGT